MKSSLSQNRRTEPTKNYQAQWCATFPAFSRFKTNDIVLEKPEKLNLEKISEEKRYKTFNTIHQFGGVLKLRRLCA